jgi:hypothetical protein
MFPYSKKITEFFFRAQFRPPLSGVVYRNILRFNSDEYIAMEWQMTQDACFIERARFNAITNPVGMALCQYIIERVEGLHLETAQAISAVELIEIFEPPIQKKGMVFSIIELIKGMRLAV